MNPGEIPDHAIIVTPIAGGPPRGCDKPGCRQSAWWRATTPIHEAAGCRDHVEAALFYALRPWLEKLKHDAAR